MKSIKYIRRLPFWLSLISLAIVVYDLGYHQDPGRSRLINIVYYVTLITGAISLGVRYLFRKSRPKLKVWVFDSLYLLLLIVVFLVTMGHASFIFLEDTAWKYLALCAVFIREYAIVKDPFTKQFLNPAQLFIVSFVLLILFGTFLLMLPNATTNGIAFVDALFTSTSAVCVTGLSVVNTGAAFTQFGLVILMGLVQLGGLGIMTFTSYFAYFFRGSISYENQLLMRELTNEQKIAEVFGTLRKILLVTFAVEAIGAVMIYTSIEASMIPAIDDRFFFALFHSICAFCNAGFSTLGANLYDITVRYNYYLQLTVAFLIILGGIGFPILFNLMNYIKYVAANTVLPFSGRRKEFVHRPWVINLNTRLVVISTGILLAVGTVFIYVLEYNNTLAEHGPFGKVVTAFFGSITPRTAGFNSVDYTAMYFPTIMIIVFLMWVGGSPASTAGGIKTSTLAVATLNFFSLARNKDRVEFSRREITESSIRRASAIICLSLIVIGMAVFWIAFFDPHLDLVQVAFECFSAYGTVGLSMNLTPSLSSASKLVIIFTMFIGRVGMLTIMIAVLSRIGHAKYRYPTESILIN